MRTVLIVLAFFSALPAVLPAQSLRDCGCADVREMRDRWCSARAAKAEYQRIVSYLNSETKKTGQTRMFSNADKNMINQKCVQEALNAVSDFDVVKATAVTNENLPPESLLLDDCRVVVTSKNHTACLKQIVEAHEGMHREACVNRKESGGLLSLLTQGEISSALALHNLGDTKYLLTSAQFASEEAASYATEMQLLAEKWQLLQQRCPATVFKPELDNPDSAGKQLWDNTQPDSDGKRRYQMYDLTEDPCPRRPPPPTSDCKLK